MRELRSVLLSGLDLANRPFGGTNADAVAGSIRLAQEAERLGFERFWVAEHHGMPGIASSAPAVLISGIAVRTDRIRPILGGGSDVAGCPDARERRVAEEPGQALGDVASTEARLVTRERELGLP